MYILNFITCTDKALRAYESGRQFLQAYVASNNHTSLFFKAVGEFETCVTTVNRALKLAIRMARHPLNPEIDQLNRKLLERDGNALEPIRNVIEHIDGAIASGEILPGRAVMLTVSQDERGLEIGDYRLEFESLSRTIRRLHHVATALSSRERMP